MLLGFTYQLMRFITDLVLVRTRSDAQLRAEVLALRHQLRVLERKVGKPAWQPGDRIWLASLSHLLPKSGLPSLLPKPETLLRWHRDLVCHKWAAFHQRPRRQRPVRDPERRALTLKLAEENPRWGYRRIQGEMVKLGFRISHMQVARILRSQGIPPAPRRSQTTWREFVRQQAAQMLACDFFTVETVWLQRLHVLFFTEIASGCGRGGRLWKAAHLRRSKSRCERSTVSGLGSSEDQLDVVISLLRAAKRMRSPGSKARLPTLRSPRAGGAGPAPRREAGPRNGLEQGVSHPGRGVLAGGRQELRTSRGPVNPG